MTRCRDEDRTENSRFIFPTCWERIVQYKTLAPGASQSCACHQSGSRDIFPRRGRGYGHCLDFGTAPPPRLWTVHGARAARSHPGFGIVTGRMVLPDHVVERIAHELKYHGFRKNGVASDS